MTPAWSHIVRNRFPVKQAWDAAALARVVAAGDIYYGNPVGVSGRLKCIDFYFGAGGIDRLYAMQPRSGSHWSELGMILAIDLARGGDGEYVLKDGLFFPRDGLASRRLDWRVPLGVDMDAYERSRGDGAPFGELLFFHSRQPYFRIRSGRLKKMRIVLLTRSHLASLEARRLKFALASPNADAYLADQKAFDWDAALSRLIEYFNSWGDVLAWHPRIRHFRYEDLVADPLAGHREILEFWGFKVPDDLIAEAFGRVTRDEMKKRIPSALAGEAYRVADESVDRRAAPSQETRRHLIARMRRELIHDLGHRHDDAPGA